jgi:DNA-binding response OmpR family regulator
MRFLIVDDDRYMITLVASILRKHKVEVVSHSNIGDALRNLIQEDFDGVLLDLHLPGMDGLAAIPLARQIRPDINIGLMTGDTSPEVRSQALSCGADFFFQKPVDLNNLWEVVKCCKRKEH